MSKTVQDMIAEIIEREGGYVNHPNDRGGPTKYGITQRTLSAHRGKPATIEDVRGLRYDEAEIIYRQMFYREPKIYLLPEAIQPQIFDMAVNHGPYRAVKYLQQYLRGCGEMIKADGLLGARTVAAANRVIEKLGEVTTNNQIAEYRKRIYRMIASHDPSQNQFIIGWLARADEFKTEEQEAVTTA